jgi:hypothetical protein
MFSCERTEGCVAVWTELLNDKLTTAPRIKPTSIFRRSARRRNPAEAPLIDAELLFRQPEPALPTFHLASTQGGASPHLPLGFH